MPLPASRQQGLSPAASSLGLGDLLRDQVGDENEEQRKKRLMRAEQMSLLGPAAMSLGLGAEGGVGGL